MNQRAARARRSANQLVLFGVALNATLAAVKVLSGIWGNSNALIADGLESAMDIFSSFLIWGALLYAGRPPDEQHPYGHGKLESLAALTGAIFLLVAGASLAIHSGNEIFTQWFRDAAPRELPRPWTLAVLVVVIFTKEVLYRLLIRHADSIGSNAIRAEAWHHRSDAITSLAAFIGISIALIGGTAWASADNWAALFSCALIVRNGVSMLRRSVGEVIDEQVSPEILIKMQRVAMDVPGVTGSEKTRVRKSGTDLIADLHVRVSGDLSVHEGHRIAHAVKDALISGDFQLADVTVHIEPDGPPPAGQAAAH
jgi:cation diffusion facilitator family transporter